MTFREKVIKAIERASITNERCIMLDADVRFWLLQMLKQYDEGKVTPNGYKDGFAYNEGLSDAWELAKKLYEMKFVETRKIFDGHERLEDIFDNFTPQEALAKLKAYEEANVLTSGDEVICLDTDEKAIFFGKSEGSQIGWFLLKEYDVPQQIMINEVKKTGKHIDIKSILEQIGE